MGSQRVTIKFTLGEACVILKFNTQIENLFSKIEAKTKELKFDRSISSKNELFIHTNTKFFKMALINEFNNLFPSGWCPTIHY